jgi:hypothetical protein
MSNNLVVANRKIEDIDNSVTLLPLWDCSWYLAPGDWWVFLSGRPGSGNRVSVGFAPRVPVRTNSADCSGYHSRYAGTGFPEIKRYRS